MHACRHAGRHAGRPLPADQRYRCCPHRTWGMGASVVQSAATGLYASTSVLHAAAAEKGVGLRGGKAHL